MQTNILYIFIDRIQVSHYCRGVWTAVSNCAFGGGNSATALFGKFAWPYNINEHDDTDHSNKNYAGKVRCAKASLLLAKFADYKMHRVQSFRWRH